MERRVQFELFGQDFVFYTDASEEEVANIIRLVRSELGADGPERPASLPSNKMLVLGCLKIAAKYVQLEKEFNGFRSDHDASIDKLIDKVSSGIDRGPEKK